MESNLNYRNLSMDEIVFDNRNKNYGAFVLRRIYEKHLSKALTITVSLFIFSMYSPKIAKSLGLFKDKPLEKMDTTIVVLQPPPSIKPDEPPPPPPPPVEEVQRPTARFLEMEAVKKEDVTEEPPPTIEELVDKDIGDKNIDAPKTDEPPPIIETVTGNGIDDKVYEKVEQMPEYIYGAAKFQQFLADNLVYPPEESSEGVQGTAKVYFIVYEDGRVGDVKLAKTSGNTRLDAEAIRLVRLLKDESKPQYKPGKQNGVAVKVLCIIPIMFQIEE